MTKRNKIYYEYGRTHGEPQEKGAEPGGVPVSPPRKRSRMRHPYEGPLPGQLPGRKVLSRCNVGNTGFFSSVKNGRLVPFESLLELKAFRILEADGSVRSYEPQARVELPCGAVRFPDVRVEYAHGVEYLEVKSLRLLRSASVRERLHEVADGLRAAGHRYRVVTERWLNQEPRRANAEELIRHRCVAIDEALPLLLAEAFGVQAGWTLGSLSEHVGPRLPLQPQGAPPFAEQALAAALHGYLSLDLTSPLSARTAVTPGARLYQETTR